VNTFEAALSERNIALRRSAPRVLQINVGKRCNQTCTHCHVNAGPTRREEMTRETMEKILAWLAKTDIETVDITGGAPELNVNFRFLVESVRALPLSGAASTRGEAKRRVIDRCNLTILLEENQGTLAEFLAHHEVEIVASLPCYSEENVDAQRGDGVFQKSIRALQRLNELGYGRDEKLILNLVYNPGGAFLPPSQAALEAEYKAHLHDDFGIAFNGLFALANLPIARFATWLQRTNQSREYSQLLQSAFNPQTVENLMCRDTISVSFLGEVYDCDFNQMLRLAPPRVLAVEKGLQKSRYLWETEPHEFYGSEIATGAHCFGCTAGAGSSCGGALR
jgi:radical SAM/Cys-rich protein